ncbi:MAG: hypothetical protein Q9191_000337 [Dirinaria sp. TL-2023a]
MNGTEDNATTELRISPRSRKHGRENAANGLGLDLPTSAPSAKRFRRSNGTDYATNGNGMAMAIDHDGDVKYGPPEHPEPISRSNSPAAEETGMEIDADGDAPAPDEAPARMTLTNGPSVGMQSDKVAEFGPETTVLPLPPGKHVTHTAWNPHDPSLLATAGDTLCRIWTIAKPPPSNARADQASPPYVDMLDSFEGSLVSTIEWGPNGDMLALATRRGPSLCVGLVSLWTRNGKSIDELPATEDMVLTFRWNPSGRLLLGITNSGAGNSTLIVWHAQDLEFRADFKLDGIVRDAAWTKESDFIICGHNCIKDFKVDGSAIKPLRSRTEDEVCHSWTHIRFDMTTRIMAIAAEEEGIIAILNPSDNCQVTTAHDHPITALAFQPITKSSSHSSSFPQILATSSLDYSIKLWDAQRPFNLVRSLSLGPSSPPMAISFTADGYLMAAANSNRVVIWNPERGSIPMSSWTGESSQWQGLATNGMDQDSGIGEEEDMPPHLLSWDASGGKLAYGLKNQVRHILHKSPFQLAI